MTIALAGDQLVAFLLASLRIVAWLVLVPPFSTRAVPAAAKVVLSLALALVATPGLVERGMPSGTLDLVLTALTQVVLGAGMGFVTFLLFGAVSSAGSLIDVFGGFALTQGFDPIAMRTNSVFGQFYQLLAAALLFATGGHLVVIGGLLRTFDVMPLGDAPQFDGASGVVLTAAHMFFLTAVQLALPLIAVLFVADLGLALLTKIAPQLNALAVMFPAKVGLTLLLLGLTLPALPRAVDTLVSAANEAMAALVGAG